MVAMKRTDAVLLVFLVVVVAVGPRLAAAQAAQVVSCGPGTGRGMVPLPASTATEQQWVYNCTDPIDISIEGDAFMEVRLTLQRPFQSINVSAPLAKLWLILNISAPLYLRPDTGPHGLLTLIAISAPVDALHIAIAANLTITGGAALVVLEVAPTSQLHLTSAPDTTITIEDGIVLHTANVHLSPNTVRVVLQGSVNMSLSAAHQLDSAKTAVLLYDDSPQAVGFQEGLTIEVGPPVGAARSGIIATGDYALLFFSRAGGWRNVSIVLSGVDVQLSNASVVRLQGHRIRNVSVVCEHVNINSSGIGALVLFHGSSNASVARSEGADLRIAVANHSNVSLFQGASLLLGINVALYATEVRLSTAVLHLASSVVKIQNTVPVALRVAMDRGTHATVWSTSGGLMAVVTLPTNATSGTTASDQCSVQLSLTDASLVLQGAGAAVMGVVGGWHSGYLQLSVLNSTVDGYGGRTNCSLLVADKNFSGVDVTIVGSVITDVVVAILYDGVLQRASCHLMSSVVRVNNTSDSAVFTLLGRSSSLHDTLVVISNSAIWLASMSRLMFLNRTDVVNLTLVVANGSTVVSDGAGLVHVESPAQFRSFYSEWSDSTLVQSHNGASTFLLFLSKAAIASSIAVRLTNTTYIPGPAGYLIYAPYVDAMYGLDVALDRCPVIAIANGTLIHLLNTTVIGGRLDVLGTNVSLAGSKAHLFGTNRLLTNVSVVLWNATVVSTSRNASFVEANRVVGLAVDAVRATVHVHQGRFIRTDTGIDNLRIAFADSTLRIGRDASMASNAAGNTTHTTLAMAHCVVQIDSGALMIATSHSLVDTVVRMSDASTVVVSGGNMFFFSTAARFHLSIDASAWNVTNSSMIMFGMDAVNVTTVATNHASIYGADSEWLRLRASAAGLSFGFVNATAFSWLGSGGIANVVFVLAVTNLHVAVDGPDARVLLHGAIFVMVIDVAVGSRWIVASGARVSLSGKSATLMFASNASIALQFLVSNASLSARGSFTTLLSSGGMDGFVFDAVNASLAFDAEGQFCLVYDTLRNATMRFAGVALSINNTAAFLTVVSINNAAVEFVNAAVDIQGNSVWLFVKTELSNISLQSVGTAFGISSSASSFVFATGGSDGMQVLLMHTNISVAGGAVFLDQARATLCNLTCTSTNVTVAGSGGALFKFEEWAQGAWRVDNSTVAVSGLSASLISTWGVLTMSDVTCTWTFTNMSVLGGARILRGTIVRLFNVQLIAAWSTHVVLASGAAVVGATERMDRVVVSLRSTSTVQLSGSSNVFGAIEAGTASGIAVESSDSGLYLDTGSRAVVVDIGGTLDGFWVRVDQSCTVELHGGSTFVDAYGATRCANVSIDIQGTSLLTKDGCVISAILTSALRDVRFVAAPGSNLWFYDSNLLLVYYCSELVRIAVVLDGCTMTANKTVVYVDYVRPSVGMVNVSLLLQDATVLLEKGRFLAMLDCGVVRNVSVTARNTTLAMGGVGSSFLVVVSKSTGLQNLSLIVVDSIVTTVSVVSYLLYAYATALRSVAVQCTNVSFAKYYNALVLEQVDAIRFNVAVVNCTVYGGNDSDFLVIGTSNVADSLWSFDNSTVVLSVSAYWINLLRGTNISTARMRSEGTTWHVTGDPIAAASTTRRATSCFLIMNNASLGAAAILFRNGAVTIGPCAALVNLTQGLQMTSMTFDNVHVVVDRTAQDATSTGAQHIWAAIAMAPQRLPSNLSLWFMDCHVTLHTPVASGDGYDGGSLVQLSSSDDLAHPTALQLHMENVRVLHVGDITSLPCFITIDGAAGLAAHSSIAVAGALWVRNMLATIAAERFAFPVAVDVDVCHGYDDATSVPLNGTSIWWVSATGVKRTFGAAQALHHIDVGTTAQGLSPVDVVVVHTHVGLRGASRWCRPGAILSPTPSQSPSPAATSSVSQSTSVTRPLRTHSRPLSHTAGVSASLRSASESMSVAPTLTVEPPVAALVTRVDAVGVREVVRAVAAIGLSITASGFGASAMFASRAGLAFLLDCGVDLAEDVDWLSSPTQLRLGTALGASFRGAVVGNLVCMCSFVVVTAIASMVFAQRQGKPLFAADGWGAARLPGILVIPFTLLMVPMVQSGVLLLVHAPDGAVDVVLGTTAIVVCLVGWWMLALVMTTRFEAAFVRSHRLPDGLEWGDRSWTVRVVDALEQHVLRGWTGSWVSLDCHRTFVQRYGVVFEGFRSKRQWFVLVEICLGLGACLLEGLQPREDPDDDTPRGGVPCHRLLACLCALNVCMVVALVACRPMNVVWEYAFAVVVVAVGSVASIVAIADAPGAEVAYAAQMWVGVVELVVIAVSLVASGRIVAFVRDLGATLRVVAHAHHQHGGPHFTNHEALSLQAVLREADEGMFPSRSGAPNVASHHCRAMRPRNPVSTSSMSLNQRTAPPRATIDEPTSSSSARFGRREDGIVAQNLKEIVALICERRHVNSIV